MLAGLLIDYNFWDHVASDVDIDKKFLPPQNYLMQTRLNNIETWTRNNLMMLNQQKSNYIIFSRSKIKFTSRLLLNDDIIEQVHAIKLLGVWISDDLSWNLNCEQLCKKAYMRMSMLTKLKYVGLSTADLLHVYILFIRSCLEYCCVLFHSSLTVTQSDMLERVQRVCLKVIYSSAYVDYKTALLESSLSSLASRREKRCSTFIERAVNHPQHSELFPLSEKFSNNTLNIRHPEKYKVNFAYSTRYKTSFVPWAQRRLNENYN